jgi:hypothetical protein
VFLAEGSGHRRPGEELVRSTSELNGQRFRVISQMPPEVSKPTKSF